MAVLLGGGRPKADIWEHVEILDEKRVKCKYCEFVFAKSANRIKSHVSGSQGKGIKDCPRFPQSITNSNNSNKRLNSDYENCGDSQSSPILDIKLNETRMLDCSRFTKTIMREETTQQQEQMNTKSGQQEMKQVGPFSIFNTVDARDVQLIEYVFDGSNQRGMVFSSSDFFLLRSEFTTLEPKGLLNSRVIDIFAEELTHIEQKTKNTPLNWYLPVAFSTAALDGDVNSFRQFIERQKMRVKYMSQPKLSDCQLMFIPVHIKKNSSGHFYLYMVHLKYQFVEIWDSLPSFTGEKEREATTQKLLVALDGLFIDDTREFSKFHVRMAMNPPLQSNEYDCGIFVIHFIQKLADMKRNPASQFHSDEERLNMALQLLKSDLNDLRETLYKEAATWHDAQGGEENWHLSGIKRKNIDTCRRFPEDVQRGAYTTFDDSNKRVKSNPGLNDLRGVLDSSNPPCGLTKGSPILDRPRDHTKLSEKVLDCYMSPKAMWKEMTQQQVQTDTKHEQQRMKHVGPFSVSNTVDLNRDDLQLIEYVFDPFEDERFDF